MLKQRVITALVLVALLLGALAWSSLAFAVLLTLAFALAQAEWLQLAGWRFAPALLQWRWRWVPPRSPRWSQPRPFHPDDLDRCRKSYLQAFKSEQPFFLEYRLRHHDGEYRWIMDTGVPLFDEEGRFGGYIGTCMDLTERKDMEDQLRRMLKEKESLLREVHHRVKNNLQVISSLLNLQSASIKDPVVNQLFRECQVRITSIALLHETLHRSHDLSRIKMGDYIRTLTGHLFRSYGVDPNLISLELNVDDVEFDIDTGQTCGLIIDELVSNCLKHAFVDDSGGTVHIDLLDHVDGSTFTLCVSDNGIGIPKDGVLNHPDSLGLELVTLLAEKLDGSTELRSGAGTEWQIRFQQLQYSERV